MGGGDRLPREGRAFRRHHARERTFLRRNRSRFRLLRRYYAFGRSGGPQLSIGVDLTPKLDIARIRAAFPGRTIEYYSTADSTMHAAARLPIGSVVLADEQTA